MAFSILPSVVSLQKYLKATHYDPTRASLIACAHAVFPLGGSRVFAIPTGGGAQDANEYLEFDVPTGDSLGFVYKVSVEIRTENVATTVTPELYNVTDAGVTWTGSAEDDLVWGNHQVSGALTVLAGKKYRLRFTKSNDLHEAWGIGVVRRTAA